MAKMTLGDLTELVRDFIPNIPHPRVARAANVIMREIHRDVGPVVRRTFTTSATTTGTTGTVTQDSTAMTDSGASFSASEVGALIRGSGDDTWFTVDAFVSTTALTLSSAWAATTVTGTWAYTIAYPMVTFPEDVLEIVTIGREGTRPLERIASDRSFYESYRIEPAEPCEYVVRQYGANGQLQVQLVQPPNLRYVYTYTARLRPTVYDPFDVSSMADYPRTYDDAILYGALHLLWDQEDQQNRSTFWLVKFRNALMQMLAQETVHAGGQYRRGAVGIIHDIKQTLPVD